MAERTWEEEYEWQQSRLRDCPPRCQHVDAAGCRCQQRGRYAYRGYFPDLEAGIMCAHHTATEKDQ